MLPETPHPRPEITARPRIVQAESQLQLSLNDLEKHEVGFRFGI